MLGSEGNRYKNQSYISMSGPIKGKSKKNVKSNL